MMGILGREAGPGKMKIPRSSIGLTVELRGI